MKTERRIRLDLLHKAAEKRIAGYVAACHAAGRVEGDFLVIPEDAARKIGKRFEPWGDRLARWLKPKVKGTRWENCSGCKKRQALMNRAHQWFAS